MLEGTGGVITLLLIDHDRTFLVSARGSHLRRRVFSFNAIFGLVSWSLFGLRLLLGSQLKRVAISASTHKS